MKHLLVALTAALLLLGTSFAQAGGYVGYSSGYYGGHHRGYHGGHISGRFGYRGGYRGSRRAANFLIGGLVLGGILNYAFSYPYRRHHHHGHRYESHSYDNHRGNSRGSYTIHRKVVRNPIYKTYSRQSAVTQQSHLHKDRHGNCFRIRYNAQGEELRTEQPRSVCNW